MTSASDKAYLLAKLFSWNSTLDDSGNELPDFPPRTDVQLSVVHVTNADVASIIKNLDLSKATGPENILAKRFKKCI